MDPEPAAAVAAAAATAAALTVSCSGKHCLHAYVPATEPYQLWKGLDRRSEEYKRLKEERSQVRYLSKLWTCGVRLFGYRSNMCVAHQCEGVTSGIALTNVLLQPPARRCCGALWRGSSLTSGKGPRSPSLARPSRMYVLSSCSLL